MAPFTDIIAAALAGEAPGAEAARVLVHAPLDPLLSAAESLTLAGHGRTVTYSRKVFIPLTQLCRDVCHYCTFAQAPRALPQPYLRLEAGARHRPRRRRGGLPGGALHPGRQAGAALPGRAPGARRARLCHARSSTSRTARARYRRSTGLLPHLNPGVMTAADLVSLRKVSVSMGLMLESASERLCQRGGAHFGSPDKQPAVRLATLAAAGELAIPVTTGLLIGIGETRAERLESLLALRALHARHGHLQELIIQNFRAKPGTRMALAPEPALEEQLWTLAVARLLFGAAMSLQAPPNLRPGSSHPCCAPAPTTGAVSPR